MKIVVMEPLGVNMELINALAAPLQAAGHDFVYYTEKETDQTKLLARVQQADIIMPGQPAAECGDYQRLS